MQTQICTIYSKITLIDLPNQNSIANASEQFFFSLIIYFLRGTALSLSYCLKTFEGAVRTYLDVWASLFAS